MPRCILIFPCQSVCLFLGASVAPLGVSRCHPSGARVSPHREPNGPPGGARPTARTGSNIHGWTRSPAAGLLLAPARDRGAPSPRAPRWRVGHLAGRGPNTPPGDPRSANNDRAGRRIDRGGGGGVSNWPAPPRPAVPPGWPVARTWPARHDPTLNPPPWASRAPSRERGSPAFSRPRSSSGHVGGVGIPPALIVPHDGRRW